MQTRRNFLQNCALMAVATSLTPTAVFAHDPAPHPIQPGLEQFARLVNTAFVVQKDSKDIELVLVEARAFAPVKSHTKDAGNEKFTLLFRGPAAEALGQDTYEFQHQNLGRTSIFIVPVTRPGPEKTDHALYTAIFDRPLDPVLLAEQLAHAPRRSQAA